MNALDQAVQAISAWGAERQTQREECVALFEQVCNSMGEALELWRAHLDDPVVLDPRRAITTLVRPDRAKRLSDIHYGVKALARRLTELTGAPFVDAFDLGEDLSIELAYRQLKLGETVADITREAVERQARRLELVQQAINAVRREPGRSA